MQIKKTLRYLSKSGTIQIPTEYLEVHNEQSFEISVEYGVICIKPFDPIGVEKRANLGIVRNLKEFNNTITIPAEFLKVLHCEPGQIFVVYEENGIIKYRKM